VEGKIDCVGGDLRDCEVTFREMFLGFFKKEGIVFDFVEK
jgi:hypothetical protein